MYNVNVIINVSQHVFIGDFITFVLVLYHADIY
jgi:hypothetical protein